MTRASGLVLFAITLSLNMIANRFVRRVRQARPLFNATGELRTAIARITEVWPRRLSTLVEKFTLRPPSESSRVAQSVDPVSRRAQCTACTAAWI